MAQGKAINNKSFYGSNETGSRPEIAMPPLDETPPVLQTGPDVFGPQQQATQQQEQGFFAVPDQVNHVFDEMNDQLEDASEQEPVEEQQAAPAKQENSTSKSWRELREKAERAERDRDELMRLYMQTQQKQQPQQEHVHEEEEHEEPDMDPEALVDGKYLNKMNQEMRKLKKELRSVRTQSAEAITEARIKAQFPDFDKVVSPENVQLLNELHPELARTLRDTPDMYNKAASAYKVIKQFGIHKDTMPDPDKQRAIKNAQKPRPLTSINPQQGASPLTKANAFATGEFSQELKQQLWKEMVNSRKNN